MLFGVSGLLLLLLLIYYYYIRFQHWLKWKLFYQFMHCISSLLIRLFNSRPYMEFPMYICSRKMAQGLASRWQSVGNCLISWWEHDGMHACMHL